MKKILITILFFTSCGLVFSQTANTKANSDTTKTVTSTVKKKLVRVNSSKINAVSTAPVKMDKANPNDKGTREEDTQPK